MAYGGKRYFKLYTWGHLSKGPIRSFKTEDAALSAFAIMADSYKKQTDLWFEVNKRTPKVFIIKRGKRVRLKPQIHGT